MENPAEAPANSARAVVYPGRLFCLHVYLGDGKPLDH